MKKNVGGTDRIARLIIGSVLVLAGISGYIGLLTLAVGPLPQALTSVVVFLVGAILLVTGTVQKCPINGLIGFNTYDQTEAEGADERTAMGRK